MTLRDVLEETLSQWGWSDEIIHDDADGTDFIRTNYQIDSQLYSLVFQVDEKRQWLSISVMAPLFIPEDRLEHAAALVNHFNARLDMGTFFVDSKGGVLYRVAFDVEGTEAAVTQFENLRSLGGSAFNRHRVKAIATLALTRTDVHDVVDDYEEDIARERITVAARMRSVDDLIN